MDLEGVEMSTSERLREALAKKGIKSGLELADYLGSKGAIVFVRGRGDWMNARAELVYRDLDGKRRREVFRPEEVVEVRQQCVDDAMDDGWTRLGIDSWSRAPFSNCWLPSEDVQRIHEEFDLEG
jgi:hypothetical protein